jgi:uncharacterized protein YjbI with pentapeptide repeats
MRTLRGESLCGSIRGLLSRTRAQRSSCRIDQHFVAYKVTMGKQDQRVVELLKRYAAGERSFRKMELAGADFSDADFSDADFSGANLRKANLSKANLRKAKLKRARLSGADLCGANLSYARLDAAKLDKADLFGAILHRAHLFGASMRGAILCGAVLDHACLVEADLTRATMTGASLVRADLLRATLVGAELTDSDLIDADLTATDLTTARIYNARLTRSNMTQANLRHATITARGKGAQWPSPAMVLLADWGSVSDELCIELMRYEAHNHPKPELFDAWSRGGPLPWGTSSFGRCADFSLCRWLWSPGPAKSAYELACMVLKEKCPDLDV